MRRHGLGTAWLAAGALALSATVALPGRPGSPTRQQAGAPRQAATATAVASPSATITAPPKGTQTVSATSTAGSTATATATATAAATATPTATGDPLSTATSTTPPDSTAAPSPTPPVSMTHRIALPVVRRSDADAVVADRVAARLMAMLGRSEEQSRLMVWDWEAGVALVALMTAYGDGRDPLTVRWVDDWLRRAERDGWIDHGQPRLTLPNHVAPVWAALLRDAHTGDGRHAALIDATRDWLTRSPRAGGAPRVSVALPGLPRGWPGAWAHLPDRPELWDDTLFMAAPFLARLGQQRGDEALIEEAAWQVAVHAAVLQDPETGLWFHGWRRGAEPPHMSGGRWARGNAWAALATTEVIDSLPEGHPQRAGLTRLLVRQLNALLDTQPTAGLWHTEMLHADFVTETSGSAGITAALYRAMAAGWLPADGAARAKADRGFAAVKAQIASDGMVRGVSAGTGVPSVEQGIGLYNIIDATRIQPYGQGLVLLMFAARERADATRAASPRKSP